MELISLPQIRAAQARLQGLVLRPPLLPFPVPELPDVAVWLKPESLQPIGSFKLRGAGNHILALPEAVRARGIVAYSSGNHAQGVAYAARHVGARAVIVMPTNAPAVKIAATLALGATVVRYDPATEHREEVAARLLAHYPGAALVPPFNDALVIAGQGTAGLEIAEDLPAVELVLVPVGGGGLISGVAAAVKALCPQARVVGVEPELAADAQASLRAGHIVAWAAAATGRTLADGVRTLAVGDLTFAHMQALVDDIVTVSEAELRAAARRLLLQGRLVVEPTAALPLAALLRHGPLGSGTLPPARRVVLLLSGGNADPATLIELLRAPPLIGQP